MIPEVVLFVRIGFLQVRVFKCVPWLVVENDESLKTLNNQMQGGDIGISNSSCSNHSILLRDAFIKKSTIFYRFFLVKLEIFG